MRSVRTGKTYAVEPIYKLGRKWGSIDPATGKLRNKKGAGKHVGAVKEEDSLLFEGDLFEKVETLGVGVSPLHAIQVRDAQYPDKSG